MPFLAILTISMLVLPAHTQDVESVAADAKPSVAVVLVQRADSVVSGTAFVASESRVFTAEHVVANARRIVVKFPQYPAMEAQLIGSDSGNDVAVLSVPRLRIRPLPLGDISRVREGQRVVVVGFPRIEALGTESATVTEGIISAVRPGSIQIQAPISPGSSGGPVLNVKGEVIGIVRSTLRGQQQGLNFATPISAATPLLTIPALKVSPPPAAPQPSAVTGQLTIQITSLTSPVFAGAEARIEIQTEPGAQCSISVVYSSGPSRASGLSPREADDNGNVVWRWRVGTNTTPGTWPLFIACTLGQQKAEIETTFTVR